MKIHASALLFHDMNDKYKPFSERHGYTQPKLPQREDMDDDLRAGLWDAFYQSFQKSFTDSGNNLNYYCTLHEIYMKVFVDFLKLSADKYYGRDTFIAISNPAAEYTMTQKMVDTISVVRDFILQHGEWFEVYDLIEFVMKNSNDNIYVKLCNVALEKENSAYKIVSKFVTEITSEQEITEIETALKIPFDSAKSHLEKALVLFSDRENPDYENSIKESISAVESIAKEITGKEKSLSAITQSLKLHPKFKTALNELYSWTNQASIRHGKSNKSLPADQDTACFMLVTCSAFVNYIIAKNPKMRLD